MARDLLQEVGRIWVDKEKTLFPFEKEVTLFLFRTWILWPEYGARRGYTAKLLAQIITLQHYDATLRPSPGRLKTLAELRERVTESWFGKFYECFISQKLVGGIDRVIDAGRTPLQQDEVMDKAIRSRAISLDMLDYLVRATQQKPNWATVRMAVQFISLNGFKRSDLYDMRRGELELNDMGLDERRKKASLSYDTVYQNWKHSKPTLGLDFVITTHWKELASLRLNDHNFLPTLSQFTNDDQKVRSILAQYHWLLDLFKEKHPAMTKVKPWPVLPDFKERQPFDVSRLADEELQIAEKADQLLHPNREREDG